MSRRGHRWVAFLGIVLGFPVLAFSVWKEQQRQRKAPPPAAVVEEAAPDESQCGEVARLVLTALRQDQWLVVGGVLKSQDRWLMVEPWPENLELFVEGERATKYLSANDRRVLVSVAAPLLERLRRQQAEQEYQNVIEGLKRGRP